MATGKLKEVEEDAVRIQTRRFKDQQEELDYQNAKKSETKEPSTTAHIPNDSSRATQIAETNSPEEKANVKEVLSKDKTEAEKGKGTK